MQLRIMLEPSEEGGYTVTVPSLPGCISEGDTREEALANIREAIQLYLDGGPVLPRFDRHRKERLAGGRQGVALRAVDQLLQSARWDACRHRRTGTPLRIQRRTSADRIPRTPSRAVRDARVRVSSPRTRG